MTVREIEKLERASQDYLWMALKAQDDSGFYEFAKRSIQNHLTTNLCNTNSYFTGMVSTEALLLPKSKRTKEHLYGMTKLAVDILNIKEPTAENIKAAILDKGRFNLTTANENMILRNNNQDYTKISTLVKIL